MTDDGVFYRFAWRWFWRGVGGLIVLLAVAYLADWAVWRVRVARGGGMDTVLVDQVVVAPLKGGKEEYYADGQVEASCSKSLFPQAGSGACWWLRGHTTVYER